MARVRQRVHSFACTIARGAVAERNAAVSWEGRWPPRAWRLAKSIVPTSLARGSKGPFTTGGAAKR
jgi:hypothetical protein